MRGDARSLGDVPALTRFIAASLGDAADPPAPFGYRSGGDLLSLAAGAVSVNPISRRMQGNCRPCRRRGVAFDFALLDHRGSP